jgi:hypothetical protein
LAVDYDNLVLHNQYNGRVDLSELVNSGVVSPEEASTIEEFLQSDKLERKVYFEKIDNFKELLLRFSKHITEQPNLLRTVLLVVSEALYGLSIFRKIIGRILNCD